MKTKNLHLSIFFFSLCLLLLNKGVQAQTNMWGLMSGGGANQVGTIVKMNMDGTGFTKVYDFIDSTGSGPSGNLVQAKNGKLYGIGVSGGDSGSCVVFSFDPVTNSYRDLYNFGTIGGDEPMSGLVEAADGNLYGVGSFGGVNDGGVIYRINPNDDSYTKVYDFMDSFGNNTTGGFPIGSLLLASDGKLYGMASSGGQYGYGVIYTFDISSGTYTDVYNFKGVTEGCPSGSLVELAGKQIYGMTTGSTGIFSQVNYPFDSLNIKGNIFKFDIGTNTYTDLYHFDSTYGFGPSGALMLATDLKLYGTTEFGGEYGSGVIFDFDLQTLAYTDLYDFGNATDGAMPMCDLKQSTDGNIYGTTNSGGTLGFGTIFKFNPHDKTLTNFIELDGVNGANPMLGGFAFAQTGNVATLFSSVVDNNSIDVYPVPSIGNVIVDINSTCNQQMTLTVSDISGKTILNQPFNLSNGKLQTQIDMSQLCSGIYFLNATIDGKRMSRKFVKE